MIRFRALLIVVLILSTAAVATLADAAAVNRPDPDAPPGALYNWLPREQWVMERWMPFNESRFYKIFHLNPITTNHYLFEVPGESLDAYAAAHGIPTSGLAQRVLGPRSPGVSVAQWHTLLARTTIVLSQHHLSQHMFFHLFHTTGMAEHMAAILGVSEASFLKLYNQTHLGFAEIAAIGGKTKTKVEASVLKLDEAEGNWGVREKAMSEQENKVLRARDREYFSDWWDFTPSAIECR
jgi:hypothetical protein